MEGAGSIAEINLRDSDLVNMPMARYAGADVIWWETSTGEASFASVYGSILLQKPEDRARIKGIIINKFRGDLRLFEQGRNMLEDLCHVPVLGVIPYMDIQIDEEDSVDLRNKHFQSRAGKGECRGRPAAPFVELYRLQYPGARRTGAFVLHKQHRGAGEG